MTNSDIEKAQRIIYLISEEIEGNLDKKGTEELSIWVTKSPQNMQLHNDLLDKMQQRIVLEDWDVRDTEDALKKLGPKLKRPVEIRLWKKIALAAAAVAVIVFGVWFYKTPSMPADSLSEVVMNDIAPGKQGATLTLANGKQIRLTDAKNGELAKEAGVVITKTADGQLIYEIGRSADASGVSKGLERGKTNTLSTARGETYLVTLPDKSKVWLNAASSLTYSTDIGERGVRKVRIEGEAYFEIAKDKAHPFVVECREQVVEVLGTHFNINSYMDEPSVETTLLEGSVNIASLTKHEIVLKPGQQSVLSSNGFQIVPADLDAVMDWKNGDFVFKDQGLADVMRKISRWYNVEVTYKGEVDASATYSGIVSRSRHISAVLEMLESTRRVKFKIKGKHITVINEKN